MECIMFGSPIRVVEIELLRPKLAGCFEEFGRLGEVFKLRKLFSLSFPILEVSGFSGEKWRGFGDSLLAFEGASSDSKENDGESESWLCKAAAAS